MDITKKSRTKSTASATTMMKRAKTVKKKMTTPATTRMETSTQPRNRSLSETY